MTTLDYIIEKIEIDKLYLDTDSETVVIPAMSKMNQTIYKGKIYYTPNTNDYKFKFDFGFESPYKEQLSYAEKFIIDDFIKQHSVPTPFPEIKIKQCIRLDEVRVRIQIEFEGVTTGVGYLYYHYCNNEVDRVEFQNIHCPYIGFRKDLQKAVEEKAKLFFLMQ